MFLNCLIVTLIFGITPILEKHILSFIEYETLILINAGFITLFGIIYYLFFYHHSLTTEISILKKNPYIFLLLALIAFFIYFIANIFYLSSIKDNKAHLVTAFIATYPIITLLTAYVLMDENISLYNCLGVILIAGGVVLLNID